MNIGSWLSTGIAALAAAGGVGAAPADRPFSGQFRRAKGAPGHELQKRDDESGWVRQWSADARESVNLAGTPHSNLRPDLENALKGNQFGKIGFKFVTAKPENCRRPKALNAMQMRLGKHMRLSAGEISGLRKRVGDIDRKADDAGKMAHATHHQLNVMDAQMKHVEKYMVKTGEDIEAIGRRQDKLDENADIRDDEAAMTAEDIAELKTDAIRSALANAELKQEIKALKSRLAPTDDRSSHLETKLADLQADVEKIQLQQDILSAEHLLFEQRFQQDRTTTLSPHQQRANVRIKSGLLSNNLLELRKQG